MLSLKKMLGLLIFGAIIPLMVIPLSPLPMASAAKITVPTHFPTIQGAIDAASQGDTIRVLPGTYNEQITISKSLTLLGSSAKSTIINAPAILDTNVLGLTYLVQVNSGAKVTMKGITITGGSSCDVFFGVTVLDSATLNLYSADITGCIQVGLISGTTRTATPQVGHATIINTNVLGYQDAGIIARAPGTTLTVSKSNIVADENSPIDGPGGITVGSGAKGNIHHNKISGNLCNNPACGPDFVTQFQGYAIVTFDAGAGTIISHNEIFGNDGGIFLIGSSGCCKVDANKLKDNRFIGIVVQDGDQKVSYNKISGGNIGVLAAAIFADTTATLVHGKIVDVTTPVQELSCCGFTAEIVTVPSNSFQTAEVKSSQQLSDTQEFVKKKFAQMEEISILSSPISPF
jgi:parallel beta-helix repeat protein